MADTDKLDASLSSGEAPPVEVLLAICVLFTAAVPMPPASAAPELEKRAVEVVEAATAASSAADAILAARFSRSFRVWPTTILATAKYTRDMKPEEE